jgi:hypothetical protein
MRLHLSFRTLGLIGLILALGLMQPVSTPFCRAQEKSAAAAQGSTVDVPVPKGTMDAITAIMTRRSIRNYTQHPVPEELIKVLVEAGMCAPSAFNERSQEFIVINDRKILDAIYNLNPKSLQIKRASVAIMVCGNQDKEKFKGQGYWQLDGSVASENILIAANAVGLGAVDLPLSGPDRRGQKAAQSAGTGDSPEHYPHRLSGRTESQGKSLRPVPVASESLVTSRAMKTDGQTARPIDTSTRGSEW